MIAIRMLQFVFFVMSKVHLVKGYLYDNRGHTQIIGCSDADWAGSPTDRRSTSGYCVFIRGNLMNTQYLVLKLSIELRP